jgi:hypothetical protein
MNMQTYTVYPKGMRDAAVSHLPEAYARDVASEGLVLMTDVDFFEQHVVASKEKFQSSDVSSMWAYTQRLDIYIKGRRDRLGVVRSKDDGLVDEAIMHWHAANKRLEKLEAEERQASDDPESTIPEGPGTTPGFSFVRTLTQPMPSAAPPGSPARAAPRRRRPFIGA